MQDISSVQIGINRKARRAYSFDEISISPSNLTLDLNNIDTSWKIKDYCFSIPVIASAMDAVVDVRFAVEMSKQGSFAVLNLEGLQTRYENAQKAIDEIIAAPMSNATQVIQNLYKEPIKDELVFNQIQAIKKAGALAVVSSTPINANHLGRIAKEAGVDIFIVQSTITTLHHESTSYSSFDFSDFIKKMDIPILVGNCVTYETAYSLMEVGISAILVGIGPGASCTTRDVLGIGSPQVTSTADVASARDDYFKKTGNYVPVITDGGMKESGDISKAIASGADVAMVGSLFARANEAPAKGYQWGMATSSYLPRGTRLNLGRTVPLHQILFGPSDVTNGTQSIIPAIKMTMASCGKKNIKEMHTVDLVFSSSMKFEGKIRK